MESVGISLGWNCHSASYGASNGLRSTKANVYTTCPFDEAITNYEGVIACIRDDFKDFMEVELLETPDNIPYMSNETLIYNRKYKFIFNHESPGHANLWESQKWTGGKYHYVANKYEKFIERYTRRITNFRNYLNSGNHIRFIITKEHANVDKLHEVLQDKHPALNYTIHRLDLEQGVNHYYSHLKLMGM